MSNTMSTELLAKFSQDSRGMIEHLGFSLECSTEYLDGSIHTEYWLEGPTGAEQLHIATQFSRDDEEHPLFSLGWEIQLSRYSTEGAIWKQLEYKSYEGNCGENFYQEFSSVLEEVAFKVSYFSAIPDYVLPRVTYTQFMTLRWLASEDGESRVLHHLTRKSLIKKGLMREDHETYSITPLGRAVLQEYNRKYQLH